MAKIVPKCWSSTPSIGSNTKLCKLASKKGKQEEAEDADGTRRHIGLDALPCYCDVLWHLFAWSMSRVGPPETLDN